MADAPRDASWPPAPPDAIVEEARHQARAFRAARWFAFDGTATISQRWFRILGGNWADGQDDGIRDRVWLDQAADAGGRFDLGLGADGVGADHSALLPRPGRSARRRGRDGGGPRR